MAVDLFSENPRSFKMNRKSPLAVSLKSAVNEKLHEFLGDCTDDILAEYIVVLVCNGKHQAQARDDLEAFLGEKSEEFVSWLWDILIKTDGHLRVGSSNLKYVSAISECHGSKDNHKFQGLQNHTKRDANDLLSKDKQSCMVKSASKLSTDGMQLSKGFQHQLPTYDTSIDDINVKDVWAQSYENGVATTFASVLNDHHEVLKHDYSRMKGSSTISAGSGQSSQYVNQQKKIVQSCCSELPLHILCSPNRESVPRDFQSVATGKSSSRPILGNAAATKFSSKPVVRVPQQDIMRRRSVWDRLGKPCGDNNTLRSEKLEVHGIEVFPRNILGDGKLDQSRLKHFAPGCRLGGRSTGEAPVPDDSYVIAKSKSDAKRYTRLGHGLKTECLPPEESNSDRKRQFDEIGHAPANSSVSLGDRKDVNGQDIETDEESQRLTYAKRSRSHNLNAGASIIEKTRDLDTYCASGCAESVTGPSESKMSQKNLNGEAIKATCTQDSVQSPLGCETEPVDNDVLITKLNPVAAQVLDVKARLHQTEMEISKLRSKQSEHIDAKPLLSFSGVMNQPEEDVESRTVFVTNVHFAATREALSQHFAKCGMVVKVTILHDPLTAQPKGAAYITFASKDSAEKAVTLSGVSFWSRNLKVVWKAEMRAMVSTPAKVSGRSPWSQSKGKVRPFSVPRLQWRRDQTVDATHS